MDYNKFIINGIYDGVVLSVLTIGNSFVLDKVIKMSPDSPKSSITLKKFGTLALAVSAAVLEKSLLEQKDVIPVDPYKGV